MTPISPIEPGVSTAAVDAPAKDKKEPDLREAAPADVSAETVRSAIDANQAVVFGGRSLEFSFNDDVNRVIVTVRSAETEEIVRQIPAEDYVKFVARFRELLGNLLDEVA